MRPSKKSQVVVITDRRDAHVPFVQRHTDVPFIIIDPQAVHEGTELTFIVHKGKLTVVYDGKPLDNVVSVWYRKPVDVHASQLRVAKELIPYVLTCTQRHNDMLLSAFRDAVWINEFFAHRRADSKAWQLEMAAQVGLLVPETIMTSSPAAAQAFVAKYKKCIVKPQSAYSPSAAGLQKGFLTTKISNATQPDLHNLRLAPAIFQQAIETVCDVRVTVIGDQVFAAKIINEGLEKDSSVLDWRIGYFKGDMQIEAFDDFPKAIARRCIQLTRALGLTFGAMDFAMDPNGKLWFLENNPNGQWGFIEESTGQPIGRALAMLLIKERKPQKQPA